jgi:hypothetical protein
MLEGKGNTWKSDGDYLLSMTQATDAGSLEK